MKTVFSSHSELAHEWANNFDQKRFGKASNMYFDGFDLFSYGRHYMVGTKIDVNGTWYTFVNSYVYSHSTAKHINHTLRALRGQNVVSFDFYDNQFTGIESAKKAIKILISQAENLFKEQLRARTNWSLYNNAVSKLATANRLSNIFGLGQISHTEDFLTLRNNAHTASNKAAQNADLANARRKEKEEIQRQIRQKSEAEKLGFWLNGEYNGQLYNLPVYLRFSKDRKTIQTSHGATVPTLEAYKLLSDLRNGVDCKGRKIGNFTLIESTLDHVKIGCHIIGWDVINQFFKD